MRKHGLEDWEFSFVANPGFLARCVYAVNKHGTAYRKKIEFSLAFVRLSVKRLREIVIHEIAHALEFMERGVSDHGPRWKSIALSLGLENPVAAIQLEAFEFPYGVFQGNRLVTGLPALTEDAKRVILAFGTEFEIRRQ